jgi:transcriptional regulator with XRE-family HTH domain
MEISNPQEFGKYIKSLRGKRSLREMGKVVGISHTYLSSLEDGFDPRSKNSRWPSIETLRKLAKAYSCSFIHLMILAGYLTESDVQEWTKRNSGSINRQ